MVFVLISDRVLGEPVEALQRRDLPAAAGRAQLGRHGDGRLDVHPGAQTQTEGLKSFKHRDSVTA